MTSFLSSPNIKGALILALPVCAMLISYSNCSDVKLKPQESSVRADEKGVVCTKTPSNLDNLNRFIFLIDISQSMHGVDPHDAALGTTRRVEGLRKLIEQFKEDDNFTLAVGALHNENVGFLPDAAFDGQGLPQLSANCEFLKPRVQQQYDRLQDSLDQLNTLTTKPSGTSPFKALFTNAQRCISETVASTSGAQISLVIVTDGAPTDVTPQQLNDLARATVLLGKKKVDDSAEASRVNLFFFFMDNFNGNPDGALMMYNAILAAQGAGGFGSRSVVIDGTGPVDYNEIGIFANRRYILKHFAATNMNAALSENGHFTVDSDSDGLDDAKEVSLGYDPTNHSTHTSCNDQIHYTNGGKCPSTCLDGRHLADSDHDGLSDCDDFALGTNPFHFDRDGDTIFDGLEKRIGSNPLDPKDFTSDFDLDGLNSFQESNQQTGVFIDDRVILHNTLTQISIQQVENRGIQKCYRISIKGMPLLKTQAVEHKTMLPLQHVALGNVIKLMFFQVAEDNPTAPPILQYAYRTLYFSDFADGQTNSQIEFTDEDFDVITPSGY